MSQDNDYKNLIKKCKEIDKTEYLKIVKVHYNHIYGVCLKCILCELYSKKCKIWNINVFTYFD